MKSNLCTWGSLGSDLPFTYSGNQERVQSRILLGKTLGSNHYFWLTPDNFQRGTLIACASAPHSLSSGSTVRASSFRIWEKRVSKLGPIFHSLLYKTDWRFCHNESIMNIFPAFNIGALPTPAPGPVLIAGEDGKNCVCECESHSHLLVTSGSARHFSKLRKRGMNHLHPSFPFRTERFFKGRFCCLSVQC